jgi:hypothetical protein
LVAALFFSVLGWNEYHASNAVKSYESRAMQEFRESANLVIRYHDFAFLAPSAKRLESVYRDYVAEQNRCKSCSGSGNCLNCGGSGVCQVCKGARPTSTACPKTETVRCSKCGGDGYSPGRNHRGYLISNMYGCPDCGGNGRAVVSGLVGSMINQGQPGTGKITRPCTKCGGSGRRIERCSACYRHQGKCGECKGSRACRACDGRGTRTSETAGEYGILLHALL